MTRSRPFNEREQTARPEAGLSVYNPAVWPVGEVKLLTGMFLGIDANNVRGEEHVGVAAVKGIVVNPESNVGLALWSEANCSLDLIDASGSFADVGESHDVADGQPRWVREPTCLN